MGAQRTGEGERKMGQEREKCPGNPSVACGDSSPYRGANVAGTDIRFPPQVVLRPVRLELVLFPTHYNKKANF